VKNDVTIIIEVGVEQSGAATRRVEFRVIEAWPSNRPSNLVSMFIEPFLRLYAPLVNVASEALTGYAELFGNGRQRLPDLCLLGLFDVK
jgi:hypothetical protein